MEPRNSKDHTSNQNYSLEEVQKFLVEVIPSLINQPIGIMMQNSKEIDIETKNEVYDNFVEN